MVSFRSAKEEIRRAADIVELVGQFVQLKKAGQNYVGLCPFHPEKAPSFTVSPSRQMFHCFGCNKGGDVFSFWMEYHGSTFPEAVRELAERYQVDVSQNGISPEERRKAAQREGIYEANEIAATYFQECLNDLAKGKAARAYLEERKVPPQIAGEFRIGFAPNAWDGLVKALVARGVKLERAVEAGLIIPGKSGGYYDRFRGRIVFPIVDLRQKVVGFGGRVLDDTLPKYLNTPETPVFRKGDVLFGMNLSHNHIRESGRAVIVEGYMDCLSLRAHGLTEVVATLGTALTERQVRKVKGYAREAIVVFDADDAGKSAASKSLPVFSNEGLTAKAAVLPQGHDPDSFIIQEGGEGFRGLLEQAVPMFDFHVHQRLKGNESDEVKAQFLGEMIPVLAEVHNFTLRSLYIRRLAAKMGIKEELVFTELERFSKKSSEGPYRGVRKERLVSGRASRRLSDFQFLNLLVNYPECVGSFQDCECELLLSEPESRELLQIILAKYQKDENFSPESLVEDVESEAARARLVEILHRPVYYAEPDVELAVAEFRNWIFQTKLTQSIQEAKRLGDKKRLVQLTKMKAQGLKSH